jgi:predicted nucleotidyltransferase
VEEKHAVGELVPPLDLRPFFDLGHKGDVDHTQAAKLLAMTPTERLRHHEGWRQLLIRGSTMPNFVEEIAARLMEAKVEFVIVGGVSAVLQGSEITTRDLDICYRRTPKNIVRLVAAIGPLNPRPRGFPPDLPFFFDERTVQLGSNFTLEIGDESLDLLGVMSAIGGYEQIIGQAVDINLAGFPIKVLSLAQLIATKEAAGREKDLAVLPALKATLARKQQQEIPRDDPPAAQ